MDRRTFMRALAGALLARECGGDAGSGVANAAPAANLAESTLYHSCFGNLHGVTFDPRTLELVYDGSAPDPYRTAQNPNRSYFIGIETPAYNAHWQLPPTRVPLPQPVNGVSRSLANPSKHTRPRYCPLDRRIHFFGGDFSTFGLQGIGQNGRAVMWSTDPIANDWTLDIDPPGGRRGDVTPLAPDLMGFTWDRNREVFWIAHGVARPGYSSEAQWKRDGNLSDTWPKTDQSSSRDDYPLFIVDPKARPMRYQRTSVAIPWNIQGRNTYVQEIAHDGVSGRLYGLESQRGGIRAWHLRTTADKLAFERTDVALSAGAPANLTGSGQWQDIVTGFQRLHVDEEARLLYFFDYRHPAVLALTLPGHAQGEGKVKLVCELPVASLTSAAMGNTASIALGARAQGAGLLRRRRSHERQGERGRVSLSPIRSRRHGRSASIGHRRPDVKRRTSCPRGRG